MPSGVPTVVDAATMTSDTIDMVVDAMVKQADEGNEFYRVLQKMKGRTCISSSGKCLTRT